MEKVTLMYALFLILNEMEKLDDILERLFALKIGATVIDSEGMGCMLVEHNREIPIFAGLRKLIEGGRPLNKTIVSVIRDRDKLEEARQIIDEELGKIDKPGKGFLFVVPVVECYGFNLEKNEVSHECEELSY